MREQSTFSRRAALRSIGGVGAASIGLTSAVAGAGAGQRSGLESFYKLDGTNATDYTGNDNHGHVDGATPGAEGRASDCFSFDGVDDVVDVPHVLSARSSGSYDVWVNPRRLDEDKAVLGDWPDGSHTLWYDVGNDHWGFAARIGGDITKVTGGSPETGRWTRLRISYNGQTLKLFVDDEEVDSTSASGSFSTESDIQIGSDEGDHNYWDGRIDEVKIYSHALWQPRNPETPEPEPPSGSAAVTDIEFANQGLAFDPVEQSYAPAGEFIFPSVVETSKLDDPLGKYHLYCAPHGTAETKDGETVGVALFYSDTLGDGSWTEYAGNPIVDPSNFDASHVSSPHAIYMDEYDELFLYWHGPNGRTRWSTSTDGVDFTYGGVAVDTSMYADSSETSYARVYDYAIPDRDNSYVMFFMDNQSGTRHIRLATSDDGKEWTVDDAELITPQAEHDGNVSGPFFFRYDGTYCVAFHASDGNQWVADVGRNLDRETHLGRFNEATSGEPDNGRCASPFLVTDEDGQPWLYYESDDRLNAAIGVEKLTDPEDAANLELFDLS